MPRASSCNEHGHRYIQARELGRHTPAGRRGAPLPVDGFFYDCHDGRRNAVRAEADAAETESVNSDLRTVNARLIAERDAAIERLNHAESIIMQ